MASVSAGNQLVLTGGNFLVPITVGGTGAAALGFGAGQNTLPTDQSAHAEHRRGGSDPHLHDRHGPGRSQ